MSATASQSLAQQEHHGEFPLMAREVNLDDITNEDLARLASIYLAVLAERRTEAQLPRPLGEVTD